MNLLYIYNMFPFLFPLLLTIFWLGCLFFRYWAACAVCKFWRLILFWLHHLQIFFPHSVGCLFVLFMVSFLVQKLLSLIKSHLFIFVTLGGGSKEILLQFMSKSVLLMFSSKSSILSFLSWWVWLKVYQFCLSFQKTSF